MDAKIRAYIDELFSETTPSRKAIELKEEMIQNLTEKYNDLLAEGKSPEASYNIVIAGIGDIGDLLKDLEKDAAHPETLAASRRKSALLTSIAVMMYIVSVVPLIVLGAFGRSDAAPIIGVVIMFFLIAGATGILIYNDMTKPKIRREDTMVAEFRQWQAASRQERALRSAISAALWAIAAATYFIVSFLTGYWHMTWLIFLIAVAVQAAINAVFTLKK